MFYYNPVIDHFVVIGRMLRSILGTPCLWVMLGGFPLAGGHVAPDAAREVKELPDYPGEPFCNTTP